MSRILVVDDEPAIGWSLRERLAEDGHAVEVAASAEAALETCGRFAPDALVLDVRLPGRDGLAALPDLRSLAPAARIVVMTAFGDLDTAVRALQAGAFDYLVKPFDLERMATVVARALADAAPADGASCRTRAPASGAHLVGTSPPMQEVFKQIALVAPTDLPVLITGETGTGKELAARAIHAHGPRAAGPFLATSLAALAPSVIESELFGHVRGAFTGATADRQGLFELAAGGTILLDEIGEAPPEVQVKLLRVLEQREITPVGSAVPRPVDVRVIAATNRDLTAAIGAGGFRGDLYHRLNVFPIVLPPLRARLDDVPALVAWFRDRFSDAAPQVGAAFLAALRERPWPGNVRELRHAVEYACTVARGAALEPDHLPPAAAGEPRATGSATDAALAGAVRAWIAARWPASGAEAGDLHGELVGLVETALAEEALARTAGNRTAAARILGVDRATFRAKLER
ncbi:MAG: sigma-54-dependent Fis family transcriptional regulator [Planctomycetia bacterium]|nr:sigma-54-dependent Fis family transcriptional regulator [Planctomycetia bacterium]